jgi:hypothetical protein
MATIDNPTSCDMIMYSTLMCFHPKYLFIYLLKKLFIV